MIITAKSMGGRAQRMIRKFCFPVSWQQVSHLGHGMVVDASSFIGCKEDSLTVQHLGGCGEWQKKSKRAVAHCCKSKMCIECRRFLIQGIDDHGMGNNFGSDESL